MLEFFFGEFFWKIPQRFCSVNVEIKLCLRNLSKGKMDSITMILIENKLDIPLDVVIFMNEWVKFNQLNDQNIKEAVKLWSNNKK